MWRTTVLVLLAAAIAAPHSTSAQGFNFTAPTPAPVPAPAPAEAFISALGAPAPGPVRSALTSTGAAPAPAPAAVAAARMAPAPAPGAVAPAPGQLARGAPAAAPSAPTLIVSAILPGPATAPGPMLAGAITGALGPAFAGTPVGAPGASIGAITTQVRSVAAAPALTGNYNSAVAPAPNGGIRAAPAPGANDVAALAGQQTSTVDAELVLIGSNLTPFGTSQERAVANSVKAVLANYTTVVSVNGATPRTTTTAPVSAPNIAPTTATVTFVPSSGPTPPTGSTTVSLTPTGRKLLATDQQSVQVNVTIVTNSQNASAVQQAINQAIQDGQLLSTLQAAGFNVTDVSAVSINVIAVSAPSPTTAPSSPVNTAPAIAPAPKSSTPTGAIVGAVVGGVVAAAALVTLIYCCISRSSRKRNKDLEANQSRLASKEYYDSASSDEANKLPAYYATNGKPPSGLAQIRTGRLGGKADPLRSGSEALSTSDSSTDYTASNERVLKSSGHVNMASNTSNNIASPGAESVAPQAVGQSADLGSEDTALANFARGPSNNLDGMAVAGHSKQVNANLWQILWKDLNVQKQIGEGSFGKVYLAKWRETTVAAKVLLGGSTNSTDEEFPNRDSPLLDGLTKEAGMMASLRHPNVVMYLGVCMEPPCVITEYCARGSLNDVLKRARYVPALAMQLDWPRRLNMCLDAAKGMMYLHSSDPPIIHRDLKSPNLLVDKHWRVKVCDFNLSRVMEETVVLSSMAASNPRWLAPEILSGRGYSYSSDVYSFGIIMWEFLTWRVPWHECGPWQVVALVTEGAARPEIPPLEAQPSKTFPGYEGYISLMQRCWAQDPDARPDFTQIISALRKLLASEMQVRMREEKATIMS